MESLETKKRAIDLGKQLVDDLRQEPGVDTLSRWMAHYVAEQIAAAENSTGKQKGIAEELCFNTVLKLWQHRANFPNGRRPLEEFEPILRALASLDPENPSPYYHRIQRQNKPQEERKPEPVQDLIDFVLAIDDATRILVREVLNEATARAASERTKTLLENAIGSPGGDLQSINLILKQMGDARRSKKDEKEAAKQRLQERIRKLDKFCALCKKMRGIFAKQLRDI